ncbi:MAG: NfeD family protein [Rickettsiales bacterium]|nr:NfeD family protein [Rickettsiales bacterium]
MNAEFVWLILGVVFIVLEIVGIPGAGFFFAGLGALVAGAFIHIGWVLADNIFGQIIIFGLATAGFAALLWHPLKKLHIGKGVGGYNNIIGDTAYVGSEGLTKGKDGEVTWSGTIMKAKLAADSVSEQLEAGAPVTIIAVQGNTVTVKPNS